MHGKRFNTCSALALYLVLRSSPRNNPVQSLTRWGFWCGKKHQNPQPKSCVDLNSNDYFQSPYTVKYRKRVEEVYISMCLVSRELWCDPLVEPKTIVRTVRERINKNNPDLGTQNGMHLLCVSRISADICFYCFLFLLLSKGVVWA